MNIFKALVMREILDGKNFYIRTPVILAGLTVGLIVLSSLFGQVYIDGDHSISNIGEGMSALQNEKPEEMSSIVTFLYWGVTMLTWIALPFVIFFSLLGTLYEERRDRSIMFWKSMPVADWQEVLAKLFVPLVVAPLIFLAVTVITQVVVSIFFGIVVAIQGGPAGEMFPLGMMISSWFIFVGHYTMGMLWTLPLLAWLLMVSSFASRMPFLWAVLPPIILIAIEGIFFKTTHVGEWLGTHLGGWREALEDRFVGRIDGPSDVFNVILSGGLVDSAAVTFTSVNMWAGLVIAGLFVYAAIEMRKRAI